MNAIHIANKLVSAVSVGFLSLTIAFPVTARAEYYLVTEAPGCDVCQTYQRPVYKKHKVHHKAHKHRVKHYYSSVPRRHSHSTLTVYYPVPTYVQTNPCGCCGGFIAPTYIWVPAPSYRVYYTHPDDRLVGNRYEDNTYPSLDTGTADNDVY